MKEIREKEELGKLVMLLLKLFCGKLFFFCVLGL